MMNRKALMLGVGAALFLASCSKKEATETTSITDSATALKPAATDSIIKATPTAAGDTSENALDWAGTYEATVPCADCPGIKTSLTLDNDKIFSITEEYLDRNSKSQDKGTFVWDSRGSIITLKGKATNHQYKVGENILIQLDMEGKEIEGPNKDLYIFKKK